MSAAFVAVVSIGSDVCMLRCNNSVRTVYGNIKCFEVQVGMHQGSALSPLLLSFALGSALSLLLLSFALGSALSPLLLSFALGSALSPLLLSFARRHCYQADSALLWNMAQ